MIEKVKLLSIIGSKDDTNRVVDTHLSRHEIHPGNALSELKTVKDPRPYIETNPYKEELLKAEELMENYHELPPKHADRRLKLGNVVQLTRSLNKDLEEPVDKKSVLVNQRNELQISKGKVALFAGLNYSVKEILRFRSIKFRFRRISKEYHEESSTYVYDTIDTVMFRCGEDGDYVWMAYFMPEKLINKIDATYAFMHFRRGFLPDEYEGTLAEAGHVLGDRISALQKQTGGANQAAVESINNHKDDLVTAYHVIRTFSINFGVRKVAAVAKHDLHSSYTLCGWVTQKDAADS